MLKSIASLHSHLENSRVDVMTDNMAVLGAWKMREGEIPICSQYSKLSSSCVYNIDLHLGYVPSELNSVDGPSRSLGYADSMLGSDAWGR